MPAADHGEGHGGFGEGRTRLEGHLLTAGIDQVRIGFVLARHGPNADDAVFGLEHEFTVFGRVVGSQHRHAETKIDITTGGQILSRAPRDLISVQAIHS